MIIKYTVHKSEQNSLRPQTCRCSLAFSSLNKALVQLQQKPILKVGVANGIKYLITMNLRKLLASVETSYNKVSHHHIKTYLFTLISLKLHKLITTCNDNLQQLHQLSLKS